MSLKEEIDMTNCVTKLLSGLLLILLIGCIKDNSGFVPDTNNTGKTFITDIYGIVLDENNSPIKGVNALFNDKLLNTDDYGVFRYKNEKINSKHNSITISKEGYFDYTQNFRTKDITTISLRVPLIKTNYRHSYSSTINSTFSEDQLTIKLAPNSIINHTTGTQYNGQVELALKYLNPMDQVVRKYISGNLSAINAQNILGTLDSYGLAIADFKSPTGDRLNLSTNSKMELSMTIPSLQLNDAPDEISMWLFNKEKGLWIQKNKAKKVGNRYTGFVNEIGYWSFGSFQQSILLNSKIVDQSNSNLSDLDIVLSIVNSDIEIHTISEGIFSSYIPKGELLELQVFNRNKCNATPLFSKTIGPFEKDTDLGEIEVNVDEDKLIKITGKFLDCNGIPISNGHARLNNNNIYPLENGELDLNIPMCNIETIEFEVTDRMNKKTSGFTYLESPGNYALGNNSVCQDDAFYIQVNCDELNDYQEVYNYDCYLEGDSITKKLSGAQYDHNKANKKGEFFTLNFDAQDLAAIDKGKYTNLKPADVTIIIDGISKNFKIISGRVTIDNGGKIQDVIRGSYKVIARLAIDDDFEFYGDFLLPYK